MDGRAENQRGFRARGAHLFYRCLCVSSCALCCCRARLFVRLFIGLALPWSAFASFHEPMHPRPYMFFAVTIRVRSPTAECVAGTGVQAVCFADAPLVRFCSCFPAFHSALRNHASLALYLASARVRNSSSAFGLVSMQMRGYKA